MLLNELEIKALIDGVWLGTYDRTKLPAWLFEKTAGGLQEAAEFGWGNKFGQGMLKDINLETALRDNIYYFAASKTASQLTAMHQMMMAAGNKYNFVKAAVQTNEMWNRHWYETEFTTTQRIARSGREWQKIEESKETFPLLRFIAVQDKNTRDTHRALHGVTRPVDDEFWKTYFPPLDWNCRCRAARISEGKPTELGPEHRLPVKDQFRERVTDSKKIWQETHPYFDLPPEAKTAANHLAEVKIAKQPAPRPTPKPKPAPKPKPVKEAPDYKFELQKLGRTLSDEFPGVKIRLDPKLTEAVYNKYMSGFDMETYFKTTVKQLKGAGVGVEKIQVWMDDGIRFLIELTPGPEDQGATVIERAFKLDKNKKRYVSHEMMFLPKAKQGGGLSKQLFNTMYDQYKKADIKTILVHANDEVGGYTWGRYGFSMSGGKNKITRFVNRDFGMGGSELTVNIEGKREAALEIIEKFYEGKSDAVDFPMNLLADKGGNKTSLLGTDWEGLIDLTNPTQRKVFEDYLNITK